MILLDTHALLWLHTGNKRAKVLGRHRRLYISPATVLELHFLVECAKVQLKRGALVRDLVEDPRWLVDDPPAAAWFERAAAEAWTRDPFDRLIAAHASLRNWKLATADSVLTERLGQRSVLAL